LHCGLRASEVFKLHWVDIDTRTGLIAVKDAKGSKGRFAYMTPEVKAIFERKDPGGASELIYNGGVRREISKTFTTKARIATPGIFRAVPITDTSAIVKLKL
jgi:integrase